MAQVSDGSQGRFQYRYRAGPSLEGILTDSGVLPIGEDFSHVEFEDRDRQLENYLERECAGPTVSVEFTGTFGLGLTLQKIPFDTENWDSHDAWDSGAYEFVVPYEGIYQVNASVRIDNAATVRVDLNYTVTGTPAATPSYGDFATDYNFPATIKDLAGSRLFHLFPGNRLSVQAGQSGFGSCDVVKGALEVVYTRRPAVTPKG